MFCLPQFNEIIETVFADHDLSPADVPALDLYMDQVLTLFDEGLRDNKRCADDKLLTKTMINNYSKEKLLLPVKGKKYSHQHILQMLCVYQLKQGLSLADVKALTGRDDIDFEQSYRSFLDIKEQIRDLIPPLLEEKLSTDLSDPGETLALCLALSAIGSYMRRLCETIIDQRAAAAEKEGPP